jgi:hypothetical protein
MAATVDTPELCAARRDALLRAVESFDVGSLRDRSRARENGRARQSAAGDATTRARGGRRAGPRPKPAAPPPDAVIEIRVTPDGLRLTSAAGGREVLVRSRTDLAAEVLALVQAAMARS